MENRENIKTPEQLKAFLRSEMERKNPKLVKDFEGIWSAMSNMLRTEGEIKAFLKSYE